MISTYLSAFQVIFVVLLCVVVVRGHADEFLKLENCSKSEIKGCYNENDGLALCFEIKPGFLLLTDKKSNVLVTYRKLPNQRFHARVLDENFLWHHPASDLLFIRPDKTANFIADEINHFSTGLASDAEEISPARFQRVMGKLRDKKEIQLLKRASRVLHDTTKNRDITRPFQVLTMSLLANQGSNTPARHLKIADSDHYRCMKHDDNEKRGSCKDLRRDPYNNNCLGMCGPKCKCWSIVCDDCCHHRGCYEHDLCCRHREFSGYCLLPFFHSFSCKGYGGHPACL